MADMYVRQSVLYCYEQVQCKYLAAVWRRWVIPPYKLTDGSGCRGGGVIKGIYAGVNYTSLHGLFDQLHVRVGTSGIWCGERGARVDCCEHLKHALAGRWHMLKNRWLCFPIKFSLFCVRIPWLDPYFLLVLYSTFLSYCVYEEIHLVYDLKTAVSWIISVTVTVEHSDLNHLLLALFQGLY